MLPSEINNPEPSKIYETMVSKHWHQQWRPVIPERWETELSSIVSAYSLESSQVTALRRGMETKPRRLPVLRRWRWEFRKNRHLKFIWQSTTRDKRVLWRKNQRAPISICMWRHYQCRRKPKGLEKGAVRGAPTVLKTVPVPSARMRKLIMHMALISCS